MQTYSIGRDPGNQIILNDNFVSRRHAELIISDNGYVIIRDTGSSNGTFVNGNRINECYLKPGDIVKCASVFLNWTQYTTDNNFKAAQPVISYPQDVENPILPIQVQDRPSNYPQTPKLTSNNASNKGGVIVVAALLVCAFFMPWINILGNISASDLVFGDIGRFFDNGFKYVTVIIPIAGILIILEAAFSNKNYIPTSFLLFLPLLTLIMIGIAIGAKANSFSGMRIGTGTDFENFIKIFGVGFWLTLIGSFILPFLGQNSGKRDSQ